MATRSSILSWKIPWMGYLVGYSPWAHTEWDTAKHARTQFVFYKYTVPCITEVLRSTFLEYL